ncbi:MAG TPA: hypothetical protein VER79_03870, partial [Candidatus Limnocylindrales bacterium]|nr:hypothetical protein [Candidatus Limnocylindrales bacterium]
MKRSLWWMLGLTLMLGLPVAAQETPAPGSFPTVAALEAAVLPARDRADLAVRLVGAPALNGTPAPAAPHKVGDRASFIVSNSDINETFTLSATLAAVGEHIYMWVDDAASVPGPLLAELVRGFDDRMYPTVR